MLAPRGIQRGQFPITSCSKLRRESTHRRTRTTESISEQVPDTRSAETRLVLPTQAELAQQILLVTVLLLPARFQVHTLRPGPPTLHAISRSMLLLPPAALFQIFKGIRLPALLFILPAVRTPRTES